MNHSDFSAANAEDFSEALPVVCIVSNQAQKLIMALQTVLQNIDERVTSLRL